MIVPTATATTPTATLHSPQVQAVLERLYADTVATDPLVRNRARANGVVHDGQAGFYAAMRDAYLPVTPEFGKLLHLLSRLSRAACIVEFGTSFGISTIFLAAALRDNGGGRLISTELEPAKAERARRNLAAAGLDDLVEIRIGDALTTLRQDLPSAIGLVLLDGPKHRYLDVLQLLEPRLAAGCVIAGDNSDMAGAGGYLDYVRDPANGYLAAAIASAALGNYHGHEIVMRC